MRRDHGQLRRVRRALRKQGWRWEETGGGHYKYIGPDGQFFFASATPRSSRSFKDFMADLRRRGFEQTW